MWCQSGALTATRASKGGVVIKLPKSKKGLEKSHHWCHQSIMQLPLWNQILVLPLLQLCLQSLIMMFYGHWTRWVPSGKSISQIKLAIKFLMYQERAERRHFCETIGNTSVSDVPLFVSLTYSEDRRRADVDLGSGALGFGPELFRVNPDRGTA